MKNILSYRGVVLPHDCNELNHMTMTQYVDKFDQAGRRCFLTLKLDRKCVVAIEQKTNYIKETQEGDLIDIRSSLLKVGNKTFTMKHEMYCAQSDAVVGKMNIVYANFDMANKKALPFTLDQQKALNNFLKET